MIKEDGVYTMRHIDDDNTEIEVRAVFEKPIDVEKRHRIEEAEENFLKAVHKIMSETDGHTA